ncbi:MAG: hypothetical protein FWG97_05145 [Deltaproteobacteria bacterium]|nr:hypothetical protein [Deltaproteobacteria bacterium]
MINKESLILYEMVLEMGFVPIGRPFEIEREKTKEEKEELKKRWFDPFDPRKREETFNPLG